MHNKTIELKKYRDDEGISQSFLKKVITNDVSPDKPKKLQFLVGSLIDALLTTPECVKNWFYISKIDKYPAPQIKLVFDTYYERLAEAELPIIWDDQELLSMFREISNSRTKDDKVLESLNTEADYWNNLYDANGRSIVSQEYWNKCCLVASSLMANPLTTKYFDKDNNTFQQPLYWKYTDTMNGWSYNCKGLTDCLHWNHEDKTVQIVDLKTTQDNLSSWKYNVARKHSPIFQLSYYWHGLNHFLFDTGSKYKQELPMLIVENVDYPGKPRIFNLTQQDLYVGTYGAELQRNMIVYDKDEKGNLLDVDWEMKKIYGWKEAIEIYHECQLLGLPDYDIEYHKTHGISDLNLWI
jgi:hypothetical protein